MQDADYPGIVPYSRSRAMFSGDLELEERSVRGSLVVGLSDKDIRLLDFFEGNVSTDLSTRWQPKILIIIMVGIYARTGHRPPTGSLGGSRRHRSSRSGTERSSPAASTKRARDAAGGEHLCVVPATIRATTEAMDIRGIYRGECMEMDRLCISRQPGLHRG